jgi:hypothetical protein
MTTRYLFSIILCTTFHLFSFSQSLRINEVSQGGTGTQREWVELVVIPGASGPAPGSCSNFTLNAAGWILDDNDGTFSPTNHYSGSGIAGGHLRFKNQAPWNNLPVGALIVIYNSADKDPLIPADDPLDQLNSDCVYIIPSNHSSIEMNSNAPLTLPNVATGAAPAPCNNYLGYTGSIYTNANATAWGQISLANGGDAMQIRNASYTLVHGVSFGVGSASCTGALPLLGNAAGPYINPTTSANDSYYFNGTTLADYFTAGMWAMRAVGLATPGAGNTAGNTTFINTTVRGNCTCSEILPESKLTLSVTRNESSQIQLQWINSLAGNGTYEIEHSSNGVQFINIATVAAYAAGDVLTWLHQQPRAEKNYYRIKAASANGDISYSNTVFAQPIKQVAQVMMYPNPFSELIVVQRNDILPQAAVLVISDITGRVLQSISFNWGANEQQKIFTINKNLPQGLLFATIKELVNGSPVSTGITLKLIKK